MPLQLEKDYIEFLEEKHFEGYAKQLFHDNEEEYYRGMRHYLTGEKDHEIIVNCFGRFNAL